MKNVFFLMLLSFSGVLNAAGLSIESLEPRSLALKDLEVLNKVNEVALPSFNQLDFSQRSKFALYELANHEVITNTGHVAIEDAEVVIQLPGAAYLIPGYFVDVPAGYQMLWNIERTNTEECTIKFKHINPKQVARARFLMGEMPKGEPQIICPMPNVECIKASSATLGLVPEIIIQMVAPQILGGIRLK